LGGKFSSLARLELKGGRWLVLALLMQFSGLFVLRERWPQLAAGLVIGAFAILLTLCWHNRALPGMPFFLAGIFLNFLVISAKGGVMPTTFEALNSIGRSSELVTTSSPAQQNVTYSKTAVSTEERLLFLGDVIVVPLPGRFASAISLGDILIGLGIAILCTYRMGLVERVAATRNKLARIRRC
jgi:hypothetical protein